ncbi:MAG: dicarboxylate/amino acid:cation symporter, partial [Pseudomonadales bacterium]
MNLTLRILIGMGAGLVLGVSLQQLGFPLDGWVMVYGVNGLIDAGGTIFVNSLKLMVVPLVFVSLTCGAASLGDSGHMGRLGGKTLGLYLLTTALAVTLALSVALIVSPGEGAEPPEQPLSYVPSQPPSVKDTLIGIFPTNPVAAMAEGKMLQIIVFALLLGIAISRAGEGGARLKRFFDNVNEVLMKLITLLIQLAPYGVFCLMTKLFATVGWQEIYKLLGYFLTVAGTLVLHGAIVYPAFLVLLGRINPVTFFTKMREPMLVAFST